MTTSPEELHAALTLDALPGIGPVTARRLREERDSFVAALGACGGRGGASTLAAAAHHAARVMARCAALGVRAIPLGDPDYPASLSALEDPPVVLFAEGNLALAPLASVALVGARQATPYGARVVRDLAGRLAAHGVVVVSGLAAGIDAAAHAATLEARGATIAVLGTGLDIAYPASHRRLQRQIAREGLLLSELPPGCRAHAGAFPRRNRLIAALADVVVVVEAGERSGALITAQVGVAAGRIVAAVPGRVHDAQSAGTNRLLRDGAQVIAAVDDVLGLVALSARGRAALGAAPRARAAAPDADALGDAVALVPGASGVGDVTAAGAEGRVLAVLAHGARTPDELVRACEASPRDVGAALATLTVRGAVAIDAAGFAFRIDRDGRGPR